MFKIATCAEKGIYHEASNLLCQDAVGKCKTDNLAAVVLCDGAGSVSESEKASHLVCDALPKYLTENYNALYLKEEQEVKNDIYNYLIEQSKKENIPLDCTMLAIVSNNHGESIILHIGDGVIIGRTDEGYEAISKPENGSESYITYFLSGETALDHLRVKKETVREILLTSDGLSDLLYSDSKVKKAVQVMLDWLKNSDEATVENKCKEEINRLFKQHTTDDISIAMMLVADNQEWGENYE